MREDVEKASPIFNKMRENFPQTMFISTSVPKFGLNRSILTEKQSLSSILLRIDEDQEFLYVDDSVMISDEFMPTEEEKKNDLLS